MGASLWRVGDVEKEWREKRVTGARHCLSPGSAPIRFSSPRAP